MTQESFEKEIIKELDLIPSDSILKRIKPTKFSKYWNEVLARLEKLEGEKR